MLLRGVHTFNPRPEDHDHTLQFTCNDNLLFLEVLKRDSNWIKVVDILGRIGYVPKDYVEPDENYSNHDLIMTFLVDAVVKARQAGLKSSTNLESLRDQIRDFPSVADRRSLEMAKLFGMEICNAKGNARRSTSDQDLNRRISKDHSTQQQKRIGSDYDASSIHSCTPMHDSNPRCFQAHQYHEDESNQSDVSDKTVLNEYHTRRDIPATVKKSKPSPTDPTSLKKLTSKLVNVVQKTSGLNPKTSESLVFKVLHHIKENSAILPVDSLLETLAISPANVSDSVTELERLMKALSNTSKEGVRDCNAPGRRRQSDSEFSTKLDKLQKLLINCEPCQAIPLLEARQHGFSQDLVHLYHLESPCKVKERMLEIFLIICTIDKKEQGVLLSTALPLNLARELMAVRKEGKFCTQLLELLTMLLACGETMPEAHYNILGTGFVNFLLTEIENTFSKCCEYYDKMSDKFSALMDLILAYNLQFQASRENILLKVLENRRPPKGFFRELIKLFKKGLDPLRRELDDYKDIPHSVFKAVYDICLCQRTLEQLTTTDRKNITDTVIDGLQSGKAGSTRLGYLHVLRALLGNFESSFINLGEIRGALLGIFLDSDPLAFPEQEMIRQMSREYPMLFVCSISRMKTNVDMDSINTQDELSNLSS